MVRSDIEWTPELPPTIEFFRALGYVVHEIEVLMLFTLSHVVATAGYLGVKGGIVTLVATSMVAQGGQGGARNSMYTMLGVISPRSAYGLPSHTWSMSSFDSFLYSCLDTRGLWFIAPNLTRWNAAVLRDEEGRALVGPKGGKNQSKGDKGG